MLIMRNTLFNSSSLIVILISNYIKTVTVLPCNRAWDLSSYVKMIPSEKILLQQGITIKNKINTYNNEDKYQYVDNEQSRGLQYTVYCGITQELECPPLTTWHMNAEASWNMEASHL